MTNIEPAAYPQMLLYRLMRYAPAGRESGIFLGHGKLDDTTDKFLQGRLDLARRFVEARPGLFQIVSSGRWRTEQSLVFDSEAEKPSLAVLAVELAFNSVHMAGPQRPMSDFELLAAVIAMGDVNGTYGSSYWGDEQGVLQLLACGINWSLYRGVDDTLWTEWGGTFGEDERVKKFGASLHCNCETESWSPGLDFGIEPPSIAQLLHGLGTGSLEKIFGV